MISDNVEEIADGAFECTGLISIVIPNKVTKIGVAAFNGCSSLISVEIPNSVIKIEESAFSGCSRLSRVVIPNSVQEIGVGAFNGCNLPRYVKSELTAKFGESIFE